MNENAGSNVKFGELIGATCEEHEHVAQPNDEGLNQLLNALYQCFPELVPFVHHLMQFQVSRNLFVESYSPTSLLFQTSEHDHDGQR
jgi:hypothetical protein